MCATCCRPYRFSLGGGAYSYIGRELVATEERKMFVLLSVPVRPRHVDQQQIRLYLTLKKNEHSDEVKKKKKLSAIHLLQAIWI